MDIIKPGIIELFQDLKRIVDRIPPDFGGGSPLPKVLLMAYTALEYDLKNYVEIGIYRGRSFFPMAHVAKLLGGMAYGIDAYDYETAKEYDLDEDFRRKVEDFLKTLDFSQIYKDVKDLRKQLDFTENSKIIRNTSKLAAVYFQENSIPVDMLHIDGNHDTKAVLEDVDLYLPLMRNGGFLVVDDVNWDSVNLVYKQLAKKHDVVFNNGFFAILYTGSPKKKVTSLEKHIFNFLHSMIEIENARPQTGTEARLAAQVAENERVTQAYSAQVAEDERVTQLCSAQVAENERLAQSYSAQVAETERVTQLFSAQVAENERLVQAYSAQVAENEQLVQAYSAQVAENERVTQAYTSQVAENERLTRAYSAQVGENERLAQAYSAQVAENERVTQSYKSQVAEKDRAITHYETILAEKENHIKNLEISIDSMYRSFSFKITRPLRDAKRFALKVIRTVRSMIRQTGKLVFHAIPASPRKKLQLKESVLHNFGFISKILTDDTVLPAGSQPVNNPQFKTAPSETPIVENKLTPSLPLVRIVDRKKISVIVSSYNHERYIRQCIDSILDQKGNFDLEIILGDDCSKDKTPEILHQYFETYPHIFKMLPKQENMGVTKNLKRCLDACQGDFIAICEGDDYWTDEYKLQKQMEFLEKHPDYSMCFSSFMIFYQEENKFLPFRDQTLLEKDVITTEDLIQKNYIGNFSCCMYRTSVVRKLPIEIFDVFTVDWMFNMACGEIGKIGFIRDCMSVYRKHSNAAWSGKPVAVQIEKLLILIDIYDKLLDHKFHNQFTKLKLNIDSVYYQNDLLILDTIFPHPLSPFRYQEFISYLDYFSRSLVLTTGEHFPSLCESRSAGEVISEFEKEHREYKGRTIVTSHDIEPYSAKLAYIVFLNNMKVFLETLEKKRIPFIFTLYPGGGFELNKPESDDALIKIFNSPQFRKVIATQKITYDYLISKKLCSPDRIEYIFGVVTPLELLKPYTRKKFFGFEKDTLDICFVSYKYMPKGIDKGFDVFIEIARKLAKTHPNIRYHVVGNFSEADIPVKELAGKIIYYGSQRKEWFDSFFLDKDIILSPNVPFTFMAGSFDGFPTASCTEAGLRQVALLCTDTLNLNERFLDGEDIIIIPHDSDKIVDIINQLYSNPEKLKKIAENGSARIRDLYSYANQIAPRIKILEWGMELSKGRSQNG